MLAIYHRCPRHMVGEVLYPLNTLKHLRKKLACLIELPIVNWMPCQQKHWRGTITWPRKKRLLVSLWAFPM
jgi:hypothetical protein